MKEFFMHLWMDSNFIIFLLCIQEQKNHIKIQ